MGKEANLGSEEGERGKEVDLGHSIAHSQLVAGLAKPVGQALTGIV